MENKTEKEVIVILFTHYLEILQNNSERFKEKTVPEKCSYDNLVKLSKEAINNAEKYPNDKLQRWLGFTQGVLATLGFIDVDKERDFTRPYLHSYQKEKPPSFDSQI